MRIKNPEEYYRPKRIIDLDGWEIVFRMGVGRPFEVESEEDYSSSIPMSLDLEKIFQLAGKRKDSPHMKPFYASKYSKLECTDVLISVSFSKTISDETIERIRELIKTLTKKEISSMKPKIGEIVTSLINASTLNESLYTAYKKNKKDEEMRKHLSPTIDEINKKIRSVIHNTLFDENAEDFAKYTDVRESLYENGFSIKTLDGERKYSMYKRSANKAKSGSCMFIWDELRDEMMDWSWLGKQFEEGAECNLTSARAYESLVQSSIISKVNIPLKSILLLDSVESDFVEGNRRILTQNKDQKTVLVTTDEYKEIKGKEYRSTNIIWDGQALIDESIFEQAGLRDKGMMLLRNSFFKACGFNTKIQEYYKEKGVKTVSDMFGNEMAAEDVKMIVTVDSLKLLNFAAELYSVVSDKRIKDPDERLQKQKRRAYDHWRKKASPEFGIVKNESASYLGDGTYHEASYQVLNTLPLTKEDIAELMEDDLRYLDLLYKNEAVQLHHMRYLSSSVRKKYFIYTAYKYCEDFEKTTQFKTLRYEEISKYKDHMRKGKIKLKGDFYILCSMPMEMLEYSVDQNRDAIVPKLEKGQAYIKGLEPDEKITLFRYPHISSGSVCLLRNSIVYDYERWFNLGNEQGSNIVVVCPWNSNVMKKLGGADFDSDMAFFIKNEPVKRSAERLMEMSFLNPADDGLPVSEADESLKRGAVKYKYTRKEMAALDSKLGEESRLIGEISNIAQLFNSYFWNNYFSEERNEGYLKTVYDCILHLGILNELQIDSAKHYIAIKLNSDFGSVRKTTFDGKVILKTMESEYSTISNRLEYPPFMVGEIKRKSGKKQNKKDIEYWKCPIDFIGMVLDEYKEKARSVPDLDIEKVFENMLKKSGAKPNTRQLNKICDTISEAIENLDINDRRRKGFQEESREFQRVQIQSHCIDEIAEKNISEATMIALFKRPFERYKTDSKDGKHKKGEYKYPELALGKRAGRTLGFLFAIGERMEELGKVNVVKNCLNMKEPYRNTLEKVDERTENLEGKEVIELWGESYVVVPGRRAKEDKDV